ncbi:MAG: helix-turn-helix domain-containing protein [Gaiellaceae bacterium]
MTTAAALLVIERNLQLVEELNAETRRMLGELASTVEEEKLLTIVEVADRLGVLLPSGRAPNSLYRAARRAELRAVVVSGRLRFRPTDVDAWITAHECRVQGGT